MKSSKFTSTPLFPRQALVALLLPLAIALRHAPAYRRLAVQGGSGAIALLALVWTAERGLDLSLLPQL